MVRKKELHNSVWISMGFISCIARTLECCWLEGVRVYGLRVYMASGSVARASGLGFRFWGLTLLG